MSASREPTASTNADRNIANMVNKHLPPSETLRNATAQIAGESPIRIETPKYVINLQPRISATKLAEYCVADASRRETIVRNAKKAAKVIIIQYGGVRSAFPKALTPTGVSAASLHASASEADRAEYQTAWQHGDNLRSAAALRHLAEIASRIELKDARLIHRPQNGWGPLMLNGVRVSVQPEIVFSTEHRGVTKTGAIILNTGKDDGLSLARRSERFSMGDYLTVLVYRMLETRLRSLGIPLHTRCYALDIFRDEVYAAPSSHKMLLKNIEASCKIITLQWASIAIDADPDEIAAET